MNNLKSIALSEVYDILKYMNKMSVMKIPTEILEYIRNNKNIEFISNVDKNDIFNKNNISKEALCILAWLDLNYLASEDSKKIKLKIYNENETRYQEILKEKDIFNNSRSVKFKEIDKNINQLDVTKEEMQIIEYNESKIDKFISFIKNLLKLDR